MPELFRTSAGEILLEVDWSIFMLLLKLLFLVVCFFGWLLGMRVGCRVGSLVA